MPRTRNLAPGFFANEDLAAVGPHGQLLFAGLWCWADREGRLEERPKRLKAAIFPYFEADVDALLTGLAVAGFISRYEVDGERYLVITNFAKYQHPHPREQASVIPPPPRGDEPPLKVVPEQRLGAYTPPPRSDLGNGLSRTSRAGSSNTSSTSGSTSAHTPVDREIAPELEPLEADVCAVLGKQTLRPWERTRLSALTAAYAPDVVLAAVEWAKEHCRSPNGVLGYAAQCIADAPWEAGGSPNGAPVQQLEDIHDYLARKTREYEGE